MKTKYFVIIILLLPSMVYPRLWVHNDTPYTVKLVARTTVGEDEDVQVGPHSSNWNDKGKFSWAIYKGYRLYSFSPTSNSMKYVSSQDVTEGGNRKIVIKDKGTPESVYIASDDTEIRLPFTWKHDKD